MLANEIVDKMELCVAIALKPSSVKTCSNITMVICLQAPS